MSWFHFFTCMTFPNSRLIFSFPSSQFALVLTRKLQVGNVYFQMTFHFILDMFRFKVKRSQFKVDIALLITLVIIKIEREKKYLLKITRRNSKRQYYYKLQRWYFSSELPPSICLYLRESSKSVFHTFSLLACRYWFETWLLFKIDKLQMKFESYSSLTILCRIVVFEFRRFAQNICHSHIFAQCFKILTWFFFIKFTCVLWQVVDQVCNLI